MQGFVVVFCDFDGVDVKFKLLVFNEYLNFIGMRMLN